MLYLAAILSSGLVLPTANLRAAGRSSTAGSRAHVVAKWPWQSIAVDIKKDLYAFAEAQTLGPAASKQAQYSAHTLSHVGTGLR